MVAMKAFSALLRPMLSANCFESVALRRTCAAVAYEHLDVRESRTPLENQALEGIIGYPTPVMRLRKLLGNDLTSLSAHIRRLLVSQHPVVKNSWKLFRGSQIALCHGTIILLVCKATNLLNRTLPNTDQYGVLPSQRALAEVTEIINSADLIHSEMVDISRENAGQQNGGETICSLSDLTFGNKMVILGGDLLLARACKELAQLYKPQIVSLISQSISDKMGSAMWQISTSQSSPSVGSCSTSSNLSPSSFSCSTAAPRKEDFQKRFQSYWHGASLLANGCRSIAILAEVEGLKLTQVSNFGRHFAIAQQSYNDYSNLHQRLKDSAKISNVKQWLSWHQSVCLDQCDLALDALDHLPPSVPRSFLSDTIISLIQSLSP